MRSLLFAALLLTASCGAPLLSGDVQLQLGGAAYPGAGALVGLSQRMHDASFGRIDFEADFVRQTLDEEVATDGSAGDRLDQVRVGLALRPTPADRGTWVWRAGLLWLRVQGDPVTLSSPGDYGGAFLGGGYQWRLGPRLALGPDLAVAWVDAEGTGDSGFVPMGALRLLWSP